jgi:hypothetical protein
MMSSPQWLDRYRAGQRTAVWHELRQLGSTVREPGLAEQAQLVCDEMAQRARLNIEMIIERLTSAGYRFHGNDDAQTPAVPHLPPAAAADEHAAWLEDRFGPVPMTVLSWVRIVGNVWLVGTHPQWAESASADPLVIELEGSRYPDGEVRRYLDDEHDAWREHAPQRHDDKPFMLPVAPDLFHKQGLSGGGPYGFPLPDGCADGLFQGQVRMPFVSYLNWVFLSGGFPWPHRFDHHGRLKRALARDLLPL